MTDRLRSSCIYVHRKFQQKSLETEQTKENKTSVRSQSNIYIEDLSKIKRRVGTDSVGRGCIRLDIWYRSFYCSMCVAFCRSQGDNADDGSRCWGCSVR